MKANSKPILILLICMSSLTISNAQLLNFTTASGNEYSQTDASKNTEAIVVGDFNSNFQDPQAALNVNTNFLGGLLVSLR